ncbi:MAG TPA: hypothetical protein VGC56_00105 [Allosphingosinicella sp.]|jgi:hypothetical protein
MISVWNDVEYQWKACLPGLERPEEPASRAVTIMTAHLGSLQFLDVARTIAHELVEGDARETLLEAIDQLNIIREYRNYYVHGFQSVGWRASGEPVGFLVTFAARGRFTQHDLAFNEADLDQLIIRLDALRTVFGQVQNVLSGRVDPLAGEAYKLPALPPRLERLSKPKRLLFDPPSPRDFGNRG